ncbi:MAG TPA: hypothetical protein VGB50_13470 [Flavobacterium sp.]|jgi:hypothetical protein
MNTNTPPRNEEQEIDLAAISRHLGNAITGMNSRIYKGINFIRRKILIVAALFILGAVLGYFLDKGKTYEHQVIVKPNFESTDYLYSKINLIKAKIAGRDTVFLKAIGIQNPKYLVDISITPVIDIYRFVSLNEVNYRLLELLAEDGDLEKIVEGNTTSKNYPYHKITYITKGITTSAKTKDPLLKYLNNSEFLTKVQKQYINNVQEKMRSNEITLAQINGLLNEFSEASTSGGKGANLVYYNENTQLNEVLKTKNELVQEQGNHRIDLVSLDKIIKENSFSLNIEDRKGLNGKMKFVLPLLFILLYLMGYAFRSFYRKQSQLHQA